MGESALSVGDGPPVSEGEGAWEAKSPALGEVFAIELVAGEKLVAASVAAASVVAALTAKEEASEVATGGTVEKATEVAAGTVAVEASAKMQLVSGLLCTVTGPGNHYNKIPWSKHTQAD